MCTWWNFRMYNRPCCATEGTTASLQQHETIRTLQYNSISLFDSPKLLLSSCYNASASASHSLDLHNRTDTPWAGYIFSIVVRVPAFFCGGCRSRPRQRSQGNCSLVLRDISFFFSFQLTCGSFATHCIVTDTTCMWGCLQCPLCSSWKAEHFSGDVASVQEAATYFSLLVFIAVLFFCLFKSPSLFHSQTHHRFLEHCWTQQEPPHKATPPLCHRVPTGGCVHLWLLKLEVCVT